MSRRRKPKTVVYILGPMTGYEKNNRPAFRKAARTLRDLGFRVISPDELDQTHPAKGKTWADFMARDIPHLAKASMGVALPGWRHSKGATMEACILNQLGRSVVELDEQALRPVPPSELPIIVHQE